MSDRKNNSPEASDVDDQDQRSYKPENQVDVLDFDINTNSIDHNHSKPNLPYTAIQSANSVHINNPVMPAQDMAILESVYPGAIDRIFSINEKEQAFTHKLVESQHDEQIKINDRNIGISKEQSSFNVSKLYIVSALILILIGCATYLFAAGFLWGGLAFTLSTLILASIFILGYFPNSVFDAIFRRDRSDSPPELPPE